MSSNKVKKFIVAGVAVIAVIGGIKAISHARGPHHGGDQDPTGFHGRMGMRQHFSGLTKADFDTMMRERFARFDKNSDGVIDTAEIEAVLAEGHGAGRGWFGRGRGPMGDHAPGHRAQGDAPKGPQGDRASTGWFDRRDTNRDGKVTRDEALEAMKKAFAAADLDGDGRITDADLPPPLRGRNLLAQMSADDQEGGRGPGGRRFGGGGPDGGIFRALRGADTNRDNIITLDEALAHANKLFDARDRNKDNVIDAADREAARKEMTEYRVKRFLHHFGAKDGKVTREQFFARANQRFAEMDHNNDGKITREDMGGGRGHFGRRPHGDDAQGRGGDRR